MTITTQDAMGMLKSGDATVILFGEVSSAKELQTFISETLVVFERVKKDAERYQKLLSTVGTVDFDMPLNIFGSARDAQEVTNYIDAQIAKKKS